MRFIHTADIHLDSPLTGLSAYADAPAAQLRTATRDAFDGLVGAALRAEVDFMVIAGDLYDGSWKDFNTGIFFVRQMGRLRQAGIPVFLLLGNHDAESEMTRRLVLPDNVRCFAADRCSSFELPELRVALHGRSFAQAATTENLALGYPPARPGWFNIGVLHTALGGHSAHADYAPCSAEQLAALGYAYWALGHVHEHRIERLGGSVIAFPGNLQGRHVRESGPRGALLVSADGDQVTAVERLHTDVLRWDRLTVDVSGTATLPALVRQIGAALERRLDRGDDSLPLALRVALAGATPLHGELFGATARLRAEVLAQAASLAPDRLWIEKLRIETTPAVGAAALAGRADAVAMLQAELLQAGADDALLAALADDLTPLLAKLPRAVADAVPQLALLRQGELAALAQAVIPGLLAHVSATGGGAERA